MTRVLTSRRWQIALFGTNCIGALLFVFCFRGEPISVWWVMGGFFIAWLTGFLAAVLVEIGTQ